MSSLTTAHSDSDSDSFFCRVELLHPAQTANDDPQHPYHIITFFQHYKPWSPLDIFYDACRSRQSGLWTQHTTSSIFASNQSHLLFKSG